MCTIKVRCATDQKMCLQHVPFVFGGIGGLVSTLGALQMRRSDGVLLLVMLMLMMMMMVVQVVRQMGFEMIAKRFEIGKSRIALIAEKGAR